MAEVREVVAHTLSDADVRKRFNSAVETYKKKYPYYRIEPTWRGPMKCEVFIWITAVTKLKAIVTLEQSHLVFVVTYPDLFRGFSDKISEYTNTFREEVRKHLAAA